MRKQYFLSQTDALLLIITLNIKYYLIRIDEEYPKTVLLQCDYHDPKYDLGSCDTKSLALYILDSRGGSFLLLIRFGLNLLLSTTGGLMDLVIC